ncbi:hypothetical protein PMAYCL1PPCAC_23114, partial [Pristionchus mayeri]
FFFARSASFSSLLVPGVLGVFGVVGAVRVFLTLPGGAPIFLLFLPSHSSLSSFSSSSSARSIHSTPFFSSCLSLSSSFISSSSSSSSFPSSSSFISHDSLSISVSPTDFIGLTCSFSFSFPKSGVISSAGSGAELLSDIPQYP